MTEKKTLGFKPLQAPTKVKRRLKLVIATQLFRFLTILLTPLRLAISIQLQDTKVYDGSSEEILWNATGNLKNSRIQLLQDIETVTSQLSSEDITFLKERENNYTIIKSIEMQKAVVAKLRGMSLNNDLFESIVDGQLFYFYLNYFRRVEGVKDADKKAQFIMRIIEESLKNNLEYQFTYKTEDDESEDGFFEECFRPLTIFDSTQAKNIYLDWFHFKNYDFINKGSTV